MLDVRQAPLRTYGTYGLFPFEAVLIILYKTFGYTRNWRSWFCKLAQRQIDCERTLVEIVHNLQSTDEATCVCFHSTELIKIGTI